MGTVSDDLPPENSAIENWSSLRKLVACFIEDPIDPRVAPECFQTISTPETSRRYFITRLIRQTEYEGSPIKFTSASTIHLNASTRDLRPCRIGGLLKRSSTGTFQRGSRSTKPFILSQSKRCMVHVPTNGLFTAILKACFPRSKICISAGTPDRWSAR